ncbi:MAG: hypothetical protein A2Z83_04190 [Omnitrophica bacterium GWA2_52_8]|nr:MAG: hypothetical protein A2Z83_04190 [Omnitrophica bacterium GWA2_52_8]
MKLGFEDFSPVFSSICLIDEKTALDAWSCIQSFAPAFYRAQKTTPGVQMEKPICTTVSSRAFLIGNEKCGLGPQDFLHKKR